MNTQTATACSVNIGIGIFTSIIILYGMMMVDGTCTGYLVTV